MVTVAAVLSPPEAGPQEIQGIATFSVRHIAFSADGVRQLFEVCKRLIDEVIAQRADRLQTDVMEEARVIPIDELYQRASLRTQPPGPKAAGTQRT
jgi:hypothetical protein